MTLTRRLGATVVLLGLLLPSPADAGDVHHGDCAPRPGPTLAERFQQWWNSSYRFPRPTLDALFPLCPGEVPSMYPPLIHPDVPPTVFTFRPAKPYASPETLYSYPYLLIRPAVPVAPPSE